MPIEPDEFNKGYTEGTLKGRIEKILANCKAYTLEEIIKGLELEYSYDPNSPGWSLLVGFLNSWQVVTALDELEKKGKIERRSIQTNKGRSEYYKKTRCF